ncbi:hypothetical protein KRP22_008205 [Phytophthora ramorum]|nr:hypothetical protein KRP22_3784 [Phytophthora ramorum]
MVTTTLFCVLRNAGFSILVGWVFGYCYTVGNVASGKPPAEQSYASYVAANGALYHGVFSAAIVVMFSVQLTPEKFVLQPPRNASTSTEPASRTLSLAQCCFKLLYHMTPHLIFSTTAEVVGCYMLIKYLPPSGRKYKPAMYLSSFWGNFVLASAEYCKRNIFNYETVHGLARRQLRESDRCRRSSSRPRYSWSASLRRFVVIYLGILPSIMSSVVAILYVHSISLFASIDRESELMAFAIGSIVLKLTLQEVAKRYLLSTKDPLPRRMMIILVSTPTILVDTQVRMLLMRLQDVKFSVLGSAMLAIAEISVRTVKSMIVHRKMRHLLRERIVPVFAKARRRVSVAQTPHETPKQASTRRRAVIPGRPTPEGTEAHRRHFVVHAAEIYSDMYAEYMAMGCSYAIMFFFWNHPQYQFIESPSEKSEATQRFHQFLLFAFQVSVEVVVDFIACNIEVMQGIDFNSFDQNDPFLTFFMSVLAFGNVSISAGLYIHS